jgi:hypothetical protein
MFFQNRIHLIMNHVMEANDLWMGVPLQFDDHFWGEIGSVQFYCMLSRCRAVGAGGGGRGGTIPPVFGRPKNPISTRGMDKVCLPHYYLPTLFSDLPTTLQV